VDSIYPPHDNRLIHVLDLHSASSGCLAEGDVRIILSSLKSSLRSGHELSRLLLREFRRSLERQEPDPISGAETVSLQELPVNLIGTGAAIGIIPINNPRGDSERPSLERIKEDGTL